MLESLPALAPRVTVLGSTRNSAATSAGVSSASGAGADWTVRLADIVATPHLGLPPRDRVFAEVLNILEASNGTDHSNLGLFSAPPSRTIGNDRQSLAKGAETSIAGFPTPQSRPALAQRAVQLAGTIQVARFQRAQRLPDLRGRMVGHQVLERDCSG